MDGKGRSAFTLTKRTCYAFGILNPGEKTHKRILFQQTKRVSESRMLFGRCFEDLQAGRLVHVGWWHKTPHGTVSENPELHWKVSTMFVCAVLFFHNTFQKKLPGWELSLWAALNFLRGTHCYAVVETCVFRYVRSCSYVAASQILDDQTKEFYQKELFETALKHTGNFKICFTKSASSTPHIFFFHICLQTGRVCTQEALQFF